MQYLGTSVGISTLQLKKITYDQCGPTVHFAKVKSVSLCHSLGIPPPPLVDTSLKCVKMDHHHRFFNVTSAKAMRRCDNTTRNDVA